MDQSAILEKYEDYFKQLGELYDSPTVEVIVETNSRTMLRKGLNRETKYFVVPENAGATIHVHLYNMLRKQNIAIPEINGLYLTNLSSSNYDNIWLSHLSFVVTNDNISL